MTTPYDWGQENGNRTGTRWVRVENPRGFGVAATLHREGRHEEEGTFDFSVQRFALGDLEKTKHKGEFNGVDNPFVVLRLYSAHHGLGWASCGPGRVDADRLESGASEVTLERE